MKKLKKTRYLATTLVAASLIGSATLVASAQSGSDGANNYDLQKSAIEPWGYQVAYSAKNNLIWATSTYHEWPAGTPEVTASRIQGINPETGEVVKSITPYKLQSNPDRYVGSYGIAVDDKHNTVWVAASRNNAVDVYDQSTGALIRTIFGVEGAHDIAIDQTNNVAFISSPNAGKLYEFSTTFNITDSNPNNDFAPIYTITAADVPGGSFSPIGLDVVSDRRTSKVYSVNLRGGEVIEIDHKNVKISVKSTLGSETEGSGIAVDAKTNKAYVATQGSKKLYTVNLADGSFTSTTHSQSLLNVTIDKNHNRVYAAAFGAANPASANGNTILVADATTGAKVGEINLGAQPNDLVYVSKLNTLFVTDRSQDANGKSALWRIKPE